MWMYENKEVTELPDGCIGYVYLITNTSNNRMYIGKKLANFSKTKYKTVTLKTTGEKKKKKIKSTVESDWKTYYGSSPELTKDIALLGRENFTREILYFCKSKAECSYIEAREQFERRVLETTDYYNNNIMCRLHGSHILNKL